MLPELLVIGECIATERGVENGGEVAENEVGVGGARFPEIGPSGEGLPTVIVENLSVAHDGQVGELRILRLELGERIAPADVEPQIGVGCEQISLLHVDGPRGVAVVGDGEGVAPCIADELHHVIADGRHEPRVAVGGIEQHFGERDDVGVRLADMRADTLCDGVVTRGDAVENLLAAVVATAQLGGDHQPFGLAQRRGFEVITYIYIGNLQLAELAGQHAVFAVDAVEQNDMGTHGGQQLEIEVGIVADVADFAAQTMLADVGVGDVVDARNALDAPDLAEGVEQRHVAGR